MSAADDAHEARIAAYVAETVAKAPPLADWQRERLRALLAPARPADRPGRSDPSSSARRRALPRTGSGTAQAPTRPAPEPDVPTQPTGRGLRGAGFRATQREATG